MSISDLPLFYSYTVALSLELSFSILPHKNRFEMAPLATVGVLSIGDMGVGIARLLMAHNYRVITNIEGRR